MITIGRPRHRIMFEIDQTKLVDTLCHMNDNAEIIGQRVLAALTCMGSIPLSTEIGLSIYGIKCTKVPDETN